MKRISFKWAGLLALLLVLTLSGLAQGAPEQINSALSALSAEVGQTVTLPNLENWRWRQEVFDDSSLGCPVAGESYTQGQVVGYVFTLTYAEQTYDYRVSADSQIVRRCGVQSADVPTPTPPLEEQFSNPLCPAPESDASAPYMRSRLAFETQGRVTPGAPNNLRAQPSQDAALTGQLPGGSVFTVIGGPTCADAIVWWQVNFDGLVGWTAEGRAGDYFLEPLPHNQLSALPASITPDNAQQIAEISRIQGNLVPLLQWLPDARLAVPGALGWGGLSVYPLLEDPNASTDAPNFRHVEREQVLSALDLRPGGTQIVGGTSAGGTYLWNIQPGAPLIEALFLQSFQADVTAVAVTPEGSRYAVAGANALTSADVDTSNAILLWDIQAVEQAGVYAGHTAPVRALAFNNTGDRLASTGDDATLRLWDVATRAQVGGVQLPSAAKAITYSPNGQFVAVGLDSGVVLVFASTGDFSVPLATLNAHNGPVNAIAFSPDNRLLVSGGDDGQLILWSTQSDQALRVIPTATDVRVRDVGFDATGSLLAAALDDRTVRVFGLQP